MRGLKLAVCVAVASLSLAGCFSVEVASSPVLGEEVERHLIVDNYGWYLFGYVPLLCGNEKLDSWCPISVFCDEVNPQVAHEKVKGLSEREGCEIGNYHLIYDNEVMFEFYSIPVPIPWIVVRKEVSISAYLVKKGGAQ